MKATNIEWDVTDGAEEMTQEEINDVLATLPRTIHIPDNVIDKADDLTDMDEISDIISDWISDKYGYCNKGFHIEFEPETIRVNADITFKDSIYCNVFGTDIANEMLANIEIAEQEIVTNANCDSVKSHNQRFMLKGHSHKISLTEAESKIREICKYEWDATLSKKLGDWDNQDTETQADFFHRIWAENVERLW